MEDVNPLGWSDVPLSNARPIEIQNPRQSEDEGLRLLKEFVSGQGQIDLRLTEEYIEGAPHPKGKLLLEELRTGHFSVQAHLDLHGASRLESKELLEHFILRCQQSGFTCIRIIHGRGQHSPGDQPILKEQVQKWLNSRRIAKHIVAYTSATLADGGGGALYVLLWKKHR
jgi:DNA-nicking Smr family endonuclease